MQVQRRFFFQVWHFGSKQCLGIVKMHARQVRKGCYHKRTKIAFCGPSSSSAAMFVSFKHQRTCRRKMLFAPLDSVKESVLNSDGKEDSMETIDAKKPRLEEEKNNRVHRFNVGALQVYVRYTYDISYAEPDIKKVCVFLHLTFSQMMHFVFYIK